MKIDQNTEKVFLDNYSKYVIDILLPTQIEIKNILDSWQQPKHWEKYKETTKIPIPTPVRAILSRIKRPEQVVDKILRQGDKFPHGVVKESYEMMRDTIGVRVVVYVLSHLPLIDRELRSSKLFEISKKKPPKAYMSAEQTRLLRLDHLEQMEKESGYSSVHYHLRLKKSSLPKDKRPWFELQVQTLAQELWSDMEHHLGYKPGWRTHMAASRQLKILSKSISAIDEHFNFLYEELNRFQEEHTYDASDPLSVESLPSVLSEVGIVCAQRDINNILKFLYSRGVNKVSDIRKLTTARRLDIIRNTYMSEAGRHATGLEVIACLAALKGVKGQKEEIKRIKLQMEYRGTWVEIQQEFQQT